MAENVGGVGDLLEAGEESVVRDCVIVTRGWRLNDCEGRVYIIGLSWQWRTVMHVVDPSLGVVYRE